LNGAHLHVTTSDRTPGGFSPSNLRVVNASSVYEYCVIEIGNDENRLTKHILTKIHFYTIYAVTQRNITWQQVQGMDKNNGNICERYTFLY